MFEFLICSLLYPIELTFNNGHQGFFSSALLEIPDLYLASCLLTSFEPITCTPWARIPTSSAFVASKEWITSSARTRSSSLFKLWNYNFLPSCGMWLMLLEELWLVMRKAHYQISLCIIHAMKRLEDLLEQAISSSVFTSFPFFLIIKLFLPVWLDEETPDTPSLPLVDFASLSSHI
ncbi:hypothetical protein Tco_0522180 [Tanacetum coccineum]